MKKTILTLLILSTITHAIDVAVYVDFPDGSTYQKCVEVDESKTAYDTIRKTNSFGLKDFGWGHGVCNIKGEGCPTSNCWCGGSDFWNFWVNQGLAPVGIDSYTVQEEDVLAFTWGSWGSNPPKDEGFESICIPDGKDLWTPRKIEADIDQTLNQGETYTISVFRKGNPKFAEPRVKIDLIPSEEEDKWMPKDRINKAQKIVSMIADFAGKIKFTPSITGNFIAKVYKDGVETESIPIEITKQITSTTTSTTTTSTIKKIVDKTPRKQGSWWLPGWYYY